MEWDRSIAVEVHGSASTVGISVMVMVVVLLMVVEAAMVFWNGEAKSGSLAVALGGLVDLCGLMSPNNTSLSGLRALSSSYILLHKMQESCCCPALSRCEPFPRSHISITTSIPHSPLQT